MQDNAGRKKLSKQFIYETSKLYADTLVHNKTEVAALVNVYALIDRMLALSSSDRVEKMETAGRITLDTDHAPNRTFPELQRHMK